MDRHLKILVSILLVFSTLFTLSAARIADDRKAIPADGDTAYSSESGTDFSTEESTEFEPSSEETEPVSNEIIDNPEYIPDEEGKKDDPINHRPPKPPTPPPDDTIDIDTPPPPPTEEETDEPPTESETPPPTESETATSPPPTETAPPPTETEPPEEYADGWHVIGGKTYLYLSGKPVTGWQQISGLKYFFDENGVLSSKVGIDVSYAQGNTDWAKVKAAGIDYVMIRVGYRGYTKGGIYIDTDFKKNIEGALASGLDCGVYFYSQAITVEEAVEEAEFVLKAVKGFRLTYPIAFDTEYVNDPVARTHGLSDAQRTDFAIAFCERILEEGYFPTIYASKSWLLDEMEFGRIGGKYHIWLAHYIDQTNFPHKFEMWQYSDYGKIDGISSEAVDLNVCLFDYPEFMKKNGYNKL